jgi:hypothetical protein
MAETCITTVAAEPKVAVRHTQAEIMGDGDELDSLFQQAFDGCGTGGGRECFSGGSSRVTDE